MPIRVTNPRRTKLTVTVAGPLLALGGLILLGVGDMHALAAEQAAINASGADWGDVLGYDADPEVKEAARQAREDADWADTEENLGIAGMVAGGLLFGSRWLIQPRVTPTVAPVVLDKEDGTQGR